MPFMTPIMFCLFCWQTSWITSFKTNVTMENPPWMKLYFLLKMGVFQRHVVFFRGVHPSKLTCPLKIDGTGRWTFIWTCCPFSFMFGGVNGKELRVLHTIYWEKGRHILYENISSFYTFQHFGCFHVFRAKIKSRICCWHRFVHLQNLRLSLNTSRKYVLSVWKSQLFGGAPV